MNDKQKTQACDMHEALVSYLYKEASGDESRRVEAHLTECISCREELHSFQHVRDMLQQWQIDDLPVVRVVAEQSAQQRSILTVIRELMSVTPIWAKAVGAIASSLLFLAVIGTELSVGRGGVSFRADLLRRGSGAQPGDPTSGTLATANIERVRAEVKSFVNELIAESERQQRDELRAQLVNLESQLQNMHSADLSKLATRIQEQQARLRTIERDIDRREGLDLTDILFSDASQSGGRSASSGSD